MKNSSERIKSAVTTTVFCLLFFFAFVLSSVNSTGTPYENAVICIDAGHGGIDKGAYGVLTDIPESEINLAISWRLFALLEDAGFAPVMTRSDDEGLYGDTSRGFKRRDMEKRKEIAEESGSFLVVSIHCNISRAKAKRGAVVYYNPDNEKSKILAQSIATELTKLPTAGGVRLDGEEMYITHGIDLPSVIVECGFLSNADDEKNLSSPKYQRQIAKAIYNGIYKTLLTE